MPRRIKLIITREDDGYVGYPIGLKGVVVAQGESYEECLRELHSAIEFHVETFGPDVLPEEDEPREVFVAEAEIPA
jgi:predicted RNase H-like HicB family nuclease